MRFSLYLLLLFPVGLQSYVSKSFDLFLAKYNKVYEPEEYQIRKNNYETNVERIRYHNSLNKSFRLGENQFTDENLHVLKKNLFQNTFPQMNQFHVSPSKASRHPRRLFWEPLVTQVKNQGACGSCWAFSTIGAIETMLAIRDGSVKELSEQQLIDCSPKNHGCNGGLMHLALEDLIEMGGISTSNDYPYIGKKHVCSIKKTILLEGLSYRFVEPHKLDAMLSAIQKNPLCVAIAADSFEFMFYKEGVFDMKNTDLRLSHAVLLTGYDLDSEIPYWRMKNSWSSEWGENGYMRLKMEEGKGVIGVNEYVLYPELLSDP